MLIQINTDRNIDGSVRMSNYFSGVIESTLDRFNEHITRVEAHLSDENSGKEGPDDKRCMLEVRVKGLQPIAVTHKAETLDQAVTGAAEKMKNILETTIAKIRAY
ncbi:MAG TPA: HPF/RaiA family ribosome-associated protein [Chryseolinea sp.]|nr:HPF/RaiA family ribosome-associated protein [Chryseolinea sp.]